MNEGYYALLIRLSKKISLQVGRLGKYSFPVGFYIYVGSARKGLKARIVRHNQKEGKKLFWHIDYLLACPEAAIQKVYTFPLSKGDECSLVQRLKKNEEVKITHPGFGSSDCHKDCRSHLLYFPQSPNFQALDKLLQF